jgi:hypothetical protein
MNILDQVVVVVAQIGFVAVVVPLGKLLLTWLVMVLDIIAAAAAAVLRILSSSYYRMTVVASKALLAVVWCPDLVLVVVFMKLLGSLNAVVRR